MAGLKSWAKTFFARKPRLRSSRAAVWCVQSLEQRDLLSTFHVDGTAANGGDGSLASPFADIQSAIDAAAASSGDDVVLIEPGVYLENLVITDTSGALRLQGNPGVTAGVTIDGQTGDVALVTPQFDVTVADVSVTNGDRGIRAQNGSGSLTVENVIASNFARAAIAGQNISGLTVRDSSLSNSRWGIFSGNAATVSIDNVTLTQNSVAGATLQDSTFLALRDVTATGNVQRGVGIDRATGSVDIVNLTASNNDVTGLAVLNGANSLTVTGGEFRNNGNHGIDVQGVLSASIDDVEVTGNGSAGNTATTGGAGIRLHSDQSGAALHIEDSLIGGNRHQWQLGGGVLISGTTAVGTIERSIIRFNRTHNSLGGGVAITAGGAGSAIRDSDIHDNIGIYGGGIYAVGVDLDIENSTIDSNDSYGDNGEQFESVDGGGIFVKNSSLNITESTISNNNARSDPGTSFPDPASGGGLGVVVSTVRLENSTISGNTATLNGAGIGEGAGSENQSITLVNTTVTDNSADGSGGGVHKAGGSRIALANSVIAANTAITSADFSGSLLSLSYNFVGDATGTSGLSSTLDLYGTAVVPLDPGLAILADNGGRTLTHNPLPESPLINAVGATNFVLNADQRGVSRPQAGSRDIGAVEYIPAAVSSANLIVTQDNSLFEYNSSGEIVQSSVIPFPTGRDVNNVARDVTVAADGTVHIFNGTGSPYLSSIDPAVSFTAYSHDSDVDWDTSYTIEGGGIVAYENFVFATDSGFSSAGGILRFDRTTGQSVRFSSTVADYVDVNIGLNGLLYGLTGNTVHVFEPLTMQQLSTITLNTVYDALAVDSDGHIYAGTGEGMLVHFDATGRVVDRFISGTSHIIDLEIAADGRLAFGTAVNGVYMTTTQLISASLVAAGSLGSPVSPTFVSFGSYEIPSPTGSISGVEFDDANGNGVRDAGELGLPGVTVYLDANDNAVFDSGEEATITDANGFYEFELSPGSYNVRQHLPTDHILTTAGNDAGRFIGTAYTVSASGSVNYQELNYIEIDAETGQVDRIGEILSQTLHGLVRTNSGDLFGISYFDDNLYQVNPDTAALTLIGYSGAHVGAGLAYDPVEDRIFSIAQNATDLLWYLVEYDRETGGITEVGSGIAGVSSSVGIAFDEENRRVVVLNQGNLHVYGFDPAGGAPTQISDLSNLGTRSLDYVRGQFVLGGIGSQYDSRIFGLDIVTGAVSVHLQMSERARMESLDWYNDDPGVYRVDVASSQAIEDVNFGNRPGVDTTAPSGAVANLPFTAASKSFNVSVNGTDPLVFGQEQSGVVSYDIFVATESSPFTYWTTVTAASPTAVFTGESNTFYSFRSVATDHAGNVESKPIGSEAFIYVPDLDAPATEVTTVDDSSATFVVSMSGGDISGSSLERFELYVSIDGNAAQKVAELAPSEPDLSGISSAETVYQAIADGSSHTYRFYTVGVDSRGNIEAEPEGATSDVLVTAAFTPPPALDVAAFDVQSGAAQRSYIRHLDLLFNTDSGLQGILDSINDADLNNDLLTVKRFELDGSGAGEAIPLAGVVQKTGSALHFDFGANSITGDPNSSAGNGYYEIGIDLDDDGFADRQLHFYRLLGDTNGDRKVNQKDVNKIRKSIRRNLFNSDYDINGDGKIDVFDLLFAKEEKGTQLLGGLNLDD